MTMSETTRRTWIAVGLAEALFAVAYPAGALLALRVPVADTRDGWADLALFAMLLVTGAFAIVMGLPVAVHTVGRYVARYTREWAAPRAAIAQLVVGLGVGLLATAVLVPLGPVALPAAAAALVLPSGLVALGTHLLMPLALRHKWIRITSWVLGALPVGAAFVSIVILTARNS